MRRRRVTVPLATPGEWREAARSGEWAQHFSNASCFINVMSLFQKKFVNTAESCNGVVT